jgi:hypothetical protein
VLLKIDCMENNTHLVRNFLCKYYVRNKDKRVTKKTHGVGNALEMLLCATRLRDSSLQGRTVFVSE